MRLIICFLFLAIISSYSFGQKVHIVDAHKTPKQIRLDSTRPSAYIEFVKFDKEDPVFADDSEERVWLKLTNNSIWSIYVGIFTYGRDNKKSVFHFVERETDNSADLDVPNGYTRRHWGSADSELKSGKSFLVSIPKNHLAKNLNIRVEFEYEWERELNNTDYRNPTHSIFFSSSQLPDK